MISNNFLIPGASTKYLDEIKINFPSNEMSNRENVWIRIYYYSMKHKEINLWKNDFIELVGISIISGYKGTKIQNASKHFEKIERYFMGTFNFNSFHGNKTSKSCKIHKKLCYSKKYCKTLILISVSFQIIAEVSDSRYRWFFLRSLLWVLRNWFLFFCLCHDD